MNTKNGAMPRLVRLFAKLFPFIANILEGIANSLVSKEKETADIVESRFAAVDKERESGASYHQPSKDATNKEVQQLTPGPMSDSNAAIPNAMEGCGEKVSDGTKAAAQEMALRAIQADFEESRPRMRSKVARIESQDRWLFRAMLLTGSLSVLLILIGAFLFIAKGMIVAATLSEIVGLLSGSGTAIFRGLQNDLKAKSEKLESQEQLQTQFLRAFQIALTLTGAERDMQMAETAKWIREGAKGASAAPNHGERVS